MKPEEGLDLFRVWAPALNQKLPQLIHGSHFGEDVTALILKKQFINSFTKWYGISLARK